MKPFVVAGLCLVLASGSALAQGKKSQADTPDYSDAPVCDAVPAPGERVICQCETGPATGSVWGSGPYTGDSSICTAARHSGVIGADGGALELLGTPGEQSYEGSAANGVITNSWGAYSESFEVRAAPAVVEEVTEVDYSDLPVCDAVPDDGFSLDCRCESGMMTGSVWGSGPYTADSSVCAAALHAGLVGDQGGAVGLIGLAGQDGYQGSTANGVTTNDWGSYGQSFDLRMAGSVSIVEPTMPVCSTIPEEAEFYSCGCSDDISGSVWGNGPYTADSNLCTAARHAGILGSGGGVVKVIRVQGLQSYTGSQANGQATSAWGSYDSSFVFDRN